MTALLPRYINIRPGGYVCAAVGLAMCPWNLLSSSNNFTTYLSAYSVFLSSIAGVIISDYYFVRKVDNPLFTLQRLILVTDFLAGLLPNQRPLLRPQALAILLHLWLQLARLHSLHCRHPNQHC